MKRPHRERIVRAVDSLPSCPVCADRIGVYEPVAVLGNAAWRRTSIAREPLLEASGARIVHYACMPFLGLIGPRTVEPETT
jgi:hypothetical protein